jgi:hypothetical protein
MRLLKAIRVWFRVMTGPAIITPERLRTAGLL